jgi:hypothetical protein
VGRRSWRRWFKATKPSSFYGMGHSAVAGARIEEYIILFLQVAISSNYIAGWNKVRLKNMSLSKVWVLRRPEALRLNGHLPAASITVS